MEPALVPAPAIVEGPAKPVVIRPPEDGTSERGIQRYPEILGVPLRQHPVVGARLEEYAADSHDLRHDSGIARDWPPGNRILSFLLVESSI